MAIRDGRTAEQKKTLPLLVVGTDSVLSSMGERVSFAAWATCDEDLRQVTEWAERRNDLSRVRVVTADGYRPRGDVRIYPVTEEHPALARKVQFRREQVRAAAGASAPGSCIE